MLESPTDHALQSESRGHASGTSPTPRVRRRACLLLFLVYATSFLLPTVAVPFGDYLPGYRVFHETMVRGFGGGVPSPIVAWLANPLFLIGVACLALGRVKSAVAVGLLAFAAGLVPMRVFAQIVSQAIETNRLSELARMPGYFTWVGSMAALAMISGYLAGRDEHGRFRPRLRLGHLMFAVGVAALVVWGWQNSGF